MDPVTARFDRHVWAGTLSTTDFSTPPPTPISLRLPDSYDATGDAPTSLIMPGQIGPFTLQSLGASTTLNYRHLSLGGNTLAPFPDAEPFGMVGGLSFSLASDGGFRIAASVGGIPVLGGLSVGYTGQSEFRF